MVLESNVAYFQQVSKMFEIKVTWNDHWGKNAYKPTYPFLGNCYFISNISMEGSSSSTAVGVGSSSCTWQPT